MKQKTWNITSARKGRGHGFCCLHQLRDSFVTLVMGKIQFHYINVL